MEKWLPLTENFDRSLPIHKIRWDVSVVTYSGNTDYNGYLSELPNCSADGMAWNDTPNTQAGGYIRQNRFNPCTASRYAPNTFSNRYYNFTDERWTATIHTTLVSGTTYEFVCPVPLYYAGLENTYLPQLADKIQYYVTIPFGTNPDTLTFSANEGSNSVTLTSESPWTATTNDSWITLSDYTGETGGEITVSVTSNLNNPLDRTGVVTFTDGENTATLTVTQKSGGKTVFLENLYRSGNRINLMFRNGRKIYQGYSKTGV